MEEQILPIDTTSEHLPEVHVHTPELPVARPVEIEPVIAPVKDRLEDVLRELQRVHQRLDTITERLHSEVKEVPAPVATPIEKSADEVTGDLDHAVDLQIEDKEAKKSHDNGKASESKPPRRKGFRRS